jgi:hypothetical protein
LAYKVSSFVPLLLVRVTTYIIKMARKISTTLNTNSEIESYTTYTRYSIRA